MNIISRQSYWATLEQVMDPEFPISVVDMGLVRDVKEPEPGRIVVIMTYTSVACACVQWIEADIKERLLKEPSVQSVDIDVVWDPPWTVDCLTNRGKEIFKTWGLSVT